MLLSSVRRQKIRRKLRAKRSDLVDWWAAQRVLPVVLGVYLGLRLWEIL